jgi:hypothetical protein
MQHSVEIILLAIGMSWGLHFNESQKTDKLAIKCLRLDQAAFFHLFCKICAAEGEDGVQCKQRALPNPQTSCYINENSHSEIDVTWHCSDC